MLRGTRRNAENKLGDLLRDAQRANSSDPTSEPSASGSARRSSRRRGPCAGRTRDAGPSTLLQFLALFGRRLNPDTRRKTRALAAPHPAEAGAHRRARGDPHSARHSLGRAKEFFFSAVSRWAPPTGSGWQRRSTPRQSSRPIKRRSGVPQSSCLSRRSAGDRG